MPEITTNIYDKIRLNAFKSSNLDFETVTLKMALLDISYTPNQNTDEFWSDISVNEVSGTNYTTGGNSCLNPTVTDDGNGNIIVNADDPNEWAQNASGFSNARIAVLYNDTGTPTTSKLIQFSNQFTEDKGNVSNPFVVNIGAQGIITSNR